MVNFSCSKRELVLLTHITKRDIPVMKSRHETHSWHSAAARDEMNKKFSGILDGATRMALMTASKWAPTWCVSTDTSTFISHPDLIQRLAIKGISGVSWDISSGGSFQSSQWACSHSTLQNPWEVFSISSLSAALCVMKVAYNRTSFRLTIEAQINNLLLQECMSIFGEDASNSKGDVWIRRAHYCYRTGAWKQGGSKR